MKPFKIIVLVCMVLMISGCGKNGTVPKQKNETVTTTKQQTDTNEPVTLTETKTPTDSLEGMVISKLTGLPIPENSSTVRPIGIMINNIPAALPQSGIGQADVIYETLVEGGQTRLYAIFQDFDGDKIGPVRSARHYYFNFAFDFDAVYVHYGESYLCIPKYKEWSLDHLNGLSYLDTIMCFRTSDRKAPHNAYTSYKGLNDALTITKIRSTFDNEFTYGINFKTEDTDLVSEIAANKVIIPMSNVQTSHFEYDTTSKQYLRFQFGNKHIDVETNEQLVTKNIIIQKASIWNIKGDTEGRLDATLIGNGEGYYITNGKVIDITWEKTELKIPTKYYDLSGNEIILNPGKTWITVTTNNTKITFE
jgi:hypothetical protein